MAFQWKVYIKPFDDDGNYVEDWIDVTADVIFDQTGNIAGSLDNTDYDIGVFRISSFDLSLKNQHGKYSDVGNSKSIFHYTRSNSQCKITWAQALGAICGQCLADGSAMIAPEEDVIIGLLNDDSLSMALDSQNVTFKILGRESSFQNAIVPYSSLLLSDLLSVTIFKILNQDSITKLLTIDQINITPNLDQVPDDITSFETMTADAALAEILLATNSVLFIRDNAVFVQARVPSVDLIQTFYGQASGLGSENIQNILNIKTGVAKCFNFLTWDGASEAADDSSSVAKFGARQKKIKADFITNATKRLNILNSVLDEFKNPRQEFDLISPLTYKNLTVGLLSQVAIDYPTIYVPGLDPFPICGIAIAGVAKLPKALWAFTLTLLDRYKVISTSLSIQTGLITFHLREVQDGV